MVQKVETNMQNSREPKILNSWKEIASYIGRAVRTIQRYERQLGLPVHRHSATAVFAFSDELEAWLRQAPALREQRLRNHSVCPMCSGAGVLGTPSAANPKQPVQQAVRSDSRQARRRLPMRSASEKQTQPEVARG